MAPNHSCDVLYWINLHPQKRGSLEDFACALAGQCRRAGLDLRFVLGSGTVPLVRELFARHGVQVSHFDQARVGSLAYRLGLLRRFRPRLVHYRFMGLCPADALAAKALVGCKVLVADHSSGPRQGPAAPSLLEAAKRLRRRLFAARVDCYLAVSRYVARRLAEQAAVPPAKIRVVYNGVDLERFRPLPSPERARLRGELLGAGPGERLVVFVGQLSPDKGLDLLLEAAPAILAPGGVRLVIIGAGPLEEPARQAAARLGRDRLLVLGLRDDVHLFLQAADLGVFPSVWQEAFGLTIAEAAACGLPVVASQVGGIPEVVAQGRTGLLIPPGDADSLARAVLDLLADEAARAQMAAQARQRAERLFDLGRAAAQTLALYQELLA